VSNDRGGWLIEACRDVVTTVAPSKQPGIKRSEIDFFWPDGQQDARSLTWQVRPALEASPSGLVVQSSHERVEQRVVITSDGRPFRIERVAGTPSFAHVDFTREAAAVQNLLVTLDTSLAPRERAMDLTVETDHPYQSSVSVSVLVLADPKRRQP